MCVDTAPDRTNNNARIICACTRCKVLSKNQPRVLNTFFVGIAPYATPDSQQRYIIILLLQAIIPKSVTVTCNNRTPRIVNKYCSTMAVLNYTALIGGTLFCVAPEVPPLSLSLLLWIIV